MNFFSRVLLSTVFVLSLQAAQHKVILISIDGLRGMELASLPNPNWRLPNLNEIVTKGAVSEGMIGVFPTVTYPNHASMVTGVSPAVHGILTNTLFDPEHQMNGAWYWYTEQIRVPTLWDLARKAGLRTANVSWPVTVGASIDANFPEYHFWRTYEDRMLFRSISTPGLLAEYEKENGEFPISAVNDHIRASLAAFLIRTRKPDLLLIHLADLDHQEHTHGPDSPEAIRTLEAIDDSVGMVRKAVAAAGLESQTDIVIVSDHGFFPVNQMFRPNSVLASLGLLGSKDHPEKWRLSAITSGASFGLIVHDPKDHEAIDLAARTFQQLQRDGCWGIDQIYDREQLTKAKAYPDSFLAIGMKSGFAVDEGETGPWLTPSGQLQGTHGYAPGPKEMDASFAALGPGIQHQRLPRGHVVDVAPTVAALLGLQMTNVEGSNILPNR
jgi:predicted AlkP superfamily pyrophosphatase or phosphodiesterase